MKPLASSQYINDNYKGYYKDGDSEWRRLGAMGKAENIMALCGDLHCDNVLEIGAGEGSILKRLSELNFGKQLYAVEISPSGVETIRNRDIPRLVECEVFDGYDIPYEDDRFDLAILSHVVEHVEHPRALLYEATRVARYVFVEVPLEDTFRLSNEFVFDTVGHINFYSPKTIRRLLQSSNLRVLRQITTNPPRAAYTFKRGYRGLLPYYVKQALLMISPVLATKIFTYHGAVICQRDRAPR